MAKYSGPYKSWLQSGDEEFKKGLIQSLKKAGTPLELKARKILEGLGFICTSFHYLEPTDGNAQAPINLREGIWRELDIKAYKQETPPIKIDGSEIHFVTHLIGDCKYSSDKDFFAFGGASSPDLSRFPVVFNGNKILPPYPHLNFSFPMKIEGITEVDVKNYTKIDDNFNDRITHRACEQIMSALSYFYDIQRVDIETEYSHLMKNSSVEKKLHSSYPNMQVSKGRIKYIKDGYFVEIPENDLDNFLKQNLTSGDINSFPYISIDLGVPIMVIDEHRGLIKAITDEQSDIVDFEDIGYGIYVYTSENANKYDNILQNHFALPIVICNLSYLDKCIKDIETGISKTIEQTKNTLKDNPHRIVKELVLNERVITQ